MIPEQIKQSRQQLPEDCRAVVQAHRLLLFFLNHFVLVGYVVLPEHVRPRRELLFRKTRWAFLRKRWPAAEL